MRVCLSLVLRQFCDRWRKRAPYSLHHVDAVLCVGGEHERRSCFCITAQLTVSTVSLGW